MEELIARVIKHLHGRIDGFMAFRFILQPIVAAFIAIRAGRKDARTHRPAFFWALFTDPTHRKELLHRGWHDVAKLFFFAVVLDLIYQIVVFHWIYPIESLIVAACLAIFPYLLIRGPVSRSLRQRAAWARGRGEVRAHKAGL